MGGNIPMISPIMDMWSNAFMPFKQLGGPFLGAAADMQSNLVQRGQVNPFSVSSLPKLDNYVGGAIGALGNRFGMRAPNGQQISNPLMGMFLSALSK